jgi:hypothetical protein
MVEGGWGTGPLRVSWGRHVVPREQPYEQLRGSPSALIDLAIPRRADSLRLRRTGGAKRTSPSGSDRSRPGWWPGPSWVRSASGPSGSRRARAVRTGRQGSQVTWLHTGKLLEEGGDTAASNPTRRLPRAGGPRQRCRRRRSRASPYAARRHERHPCRPATTMPFARDASGRIIGRALASSACRPSGHNLGSKHSFLSRVLLAATTRRTTIRHRSNGLRLRRVRSRRCRRCRRACPAGRHRPDVTEP